MRNAREEPESADPETGWRRSVRASRLAQHRSLVRRVQVLEAEVQECRQLNVRLAELTDVVTELLLPVDARDEERLEQLLRRYRETF